MNKKITLAITGTAVLLGSTAAFVWFRKKTGAKIIRIAKGFIGQEEIPSNMGFVNSVFQSMMSTLGKWQPKYEWCASFVRMVWLMVLKGKQRYIANKLLSPSTQTTYAGFENDRSGLFSVSQTPKPGSIVIWRSKKKPHKGHAGIYIAKIKGQHYFIEGNKGNKVSLTKYPEYNKVSNDLYLRGFINWR